MKVHVLKQQIIHFIENKILKEYIPIIHKKNNNKIEKSSTLRTVFLMYYTQNVTHHITSGD